jgi:hypothetical protein
MLKNLTTSGGADSEKFQLSERLYEPSYCLKLDESKGLAALPLQKRAKGVS